MLVFLLPYVCASLWGHVGVETDALRAGKGVAKAPSDTQERIKADMEWGVWDLPMEEYLVYKLAEIMPENYEPEALKAQAVLVRTEIVRARQDQGDGRLCVSGEELEKWYAADAGARETLSVYETAAEETEGLYLSYEGAPAQAPYFRVSNGRTRDAAEVWQTAEFPYLSGVPCAQDKASPEYDSEVTLSKINFLHEIRTRFDTACPAEKLWEGMELARDGAGYVTDVTFLADGEEVGKMDGEAFRYLFGLPSASFEVRRTDTQIIFQVTGVGHGFGMSQYGANCRAINGETYDQILKEFFSGTELAKIE